MSKNKETVEKYMDAYRRINHEEILSCLADDVEWVLPGAYHEVGKEAFDKQIESDCFVGKPNIIVTRLVEEADVVVAEGTVSMAKREGGEANIVFCDVFEMQDSRIKKLTSYLMEVNPDPPA